jgi:phosphate transport system substrate-binding protein
MIKKIGLGATAVALSLSMATAGVAPANAAEVSLPIGGATFQADFQAKCITAFNAQKASSRTISGDVVTMGLYDGVGSGNGRTGLGNGSYKVAASDGLGTKNGLTAADSVYMPNVAAPLAVFINLKSSTNSKITSLNLDAQTLADIFKGNITNWNDSRITTLNQSLKLPNTAIITVTRQDNSGTTANFKNYLIQNSTASITAGESNASLQNDLVGSGAPALVNQVKNNVGSIGYSDLSDAVGVTLVAIKNKAGAFVKPSATAAATYVKAPGVLTPKVDSSITTNGGIYDVDFTKNVKNGYQISFISYMVGKKGLSTNPQVKLYLNFMLNKCSVSPSTVKASSFTTVGSAYLAVMKAQIAKL